VVELLEVVVLGLYGALAVVTLLRWQRQRDASTGWTVVVFSVLAGVVAASLLRAEDDTEVAGPGDRLLMAAFFLLPHLLFRVTAALRRPSARVRAAVALLTAGAVLPAFVIHVPPGDETSTTFSLYTAFVLAYWIGLSLLIAGWMWRGGAGGSWVVRARMRTLAVAVSLLAVVTLLLGVGSSDDPGAIEVITLALALVAGPLFLFGLAPPNALLARWGRSDEEALRDAEAALVAANSPAEVADALLPYVARALGGSVAVLTGPDGSVIASYGTDAASGAQLVGSLPEHPDGQDPRYLTSIDMRSGRLHVVGDPYTPFFGRDHRNVLARLAELTDVALRRAHVTEAERASAAEMQRAHDTMREFVSIASHDLRSPITVIQGFAQVLTSTWDTADDQAKLTYVATINRQAEQLARLADDLLTTSRIDAGAVEPDLEELDLQPLVDRVVSDLGHDVSIAVEAGSVVMADADHADRIVRNLVENALGYGAPPVEVSATPSEEHIDLRVRDHGPGVPPAFQPRLFERFARAESSKDARKGTGLGLAIVQGLARAAGGDVWYEAARPGACFVVRFRRP